MASLHRSNDEDAALKRSRRAVLVVDLVESVRLMQSFEDSVIRIWRQFVRQVREQVLPVHEGRLVKSLGDGLLIDFAEVYLASACARDLQERAAAFNASLQGEWAFCLRIGVHLTDVFVDDLDIYGSGVNLTARLAALGRPGDVVLSAEARDRLVDGLDGGAEDLGECFLKHVEGPIRAWRLVDASAAAERVPPVGPAGAIPSLVVLPVPWPGLTISEATSSTSVVADELAQLLRGCGGISVIARPTVAVLRGRQLAPCDAHVLLGVPYVLEVACRPEPTAIEVGLALFARGSSAPVLECRYTDDWGEHRPGPSMHQVAAAGQVAELLAMASVDSAAGRSLPNVESHALLLSAVARMHRMARADSERAGLALEELVQRHPRAPEAHAWLAKWHMLRVAQGWSLQAAREAQQASFHVRRALDTDPRHALALAIDGHMASFQHGNLEVATLRLNEAIASGSSEPLAWLFMSNLLAHQGQGERAMDAADRAMALSPLDPTRFMFEMFAGHAALCAGAYDRAAAFTASSLRSNGMHLPTYPAHIISLGLCGDWAGAKAAAQTYMQLYPPASARAYAGRFRGPQVQGDLFARVLHEAGIPL